MSVHNTSGLIDLATGCKAVWNDQAGLFTGAPGTQRSFVRGRFSDRLSHLVLSRKKQKFAVLSLWNGPHRLFLK